MSIGNNPRVGFEVRKGAAGVESGIYALIFPMQPATPPPFFVSPSLSTIKLGGGLLESKNGFQEPVT